MTHDSRPSVCEIEARETRQKVDQFCRELRQTKQCNPEQLSFIETVCARVKHEAATGQDRGGAAETNTEALRWALHGGPGTGKSYVLNILRRDLFEKCLGWTPGKEFQVVAFQAVNAGMARQSIKLSGCRGTVTITTWLGNGFWTWHGKPYSGVGFF